MNFQLKVMVIPFSLGVGEAEPVPQPEGRGTEVGEAKPLSLALGSIRTKSMSNRYHLIKPGILIHSVLFYPFYPHRMGIPGMLIKKHIHNCVTSPEWLCPLLFLCYAHYSQLNRLKRSNAGGRIANGCFFTTQIACGTMGSTSFSQEISFPPCGPNGTAS